MLNKLAKKVYDKAIDEYGNDKITPLSAYIADTIADILDKDLEYTEDPINKATVRRFLKKYLYDEEKVILNNKYRRTLDQLARFAGYQDYVEFTSWDRKQANTSSLDKGLSRVTINNYGKDTKIIPDLDIDGDFIINIS